MRLLGKNSSTIILGASTLVLAVLLLIKQNSIVSESLSTTSNQQTESAQSATTAPDEIIPRTTNGFETIYSQSFFDISQSQALTFVQKCQGEVKIAEHVQGSGFGTDAGSAYCIGDNALMVNNAAGEEIVTVETSTSTNVEDAPVLRQITLVGTPKKGTMLIEYGVFPCTLSGDECGVGGWNIQVTYAYDIQSATVRSIMHYPKFGEPFWNNSETKAIFPVVQIGGAGCDDRPLVGYDLLNDTTKTLTTEVGCEFDHGNASDVEGNPLPEWGPVIWTGDDTFTAILLGTDNVWKQINGTY